MYVLCNGRGNMGIDKDIRKELIARYPRIVSEVPIIRLVPPYGNKWVEIEARRWLARYECISGCTHAITLDARTTLQLRVHG